MRKSRNRQIVIDYSTVYFVMQPIFFAYVTRRAVAGFFDVFAGFFRIDGAFGSLAGRYGWLESRLCTFRLVPLGHLPVSGLRYPASSLLPPVSGSGSCHLHPFPFFTTSLYAAHALPTRTSVSLYAAPALHKQHLHLSSCRAFLPPSLRTQDSLFCSKRDLLLSCGLSGAYLTPNPQFWSP